MNSSFLKEVFYIYWMSRVPHLDEFEAIDHLEWELRSMSLTPPLKNGNRSKSTENNLKNFLKEKGIEYVRS